MHGGRDQGQFDLRCAAAKYADDVADHRAGGRADNTNTFRVRWQGDFGLGGEQPLGAELFFQRFEGQAQRAIAGRLDGIENQLVVAAPFKQRDFAAHLDRQSITQRLAHLCSVLPEQRAAHLSLAIFKGEIDVSGCRLGQVRDFPLDPDTAEYIFQQQARAVVQLTDAEHLAVEVQALEGIFDHGRHSKGFALPAIGDWP